MVAARALILAFVLAGFLSGCTSFSPDHYAGLHGFTSHVFSAETFDIAGFLRGHGRTMRVYIEGDGQAWLSRRRASPDPTPTNPMVLRMACADISNAVLYIARPCQFVPKANRRNCALPFWTNARFSEPVIHDMSQVLDQAKALAKADRLELVGYSGGGAVALLVAAGRDDVDLVVTIAGNLDHAYWTKLHAVSPLKYSVNPADRAASLQRLRQIHIVSSDDDVVPPSVISSYIGRMDDMSQVQVVTLHGIEHGGEWDKVVPAILNKVNGK